MARKAQNGLPFLVTPRQLHALFPIEAFGFLALLGIGIDDGIWRDVRAFLTLSYLETRQILNPVADQHSTTFLPLSHSYVRLLSAFPRDRK
jgi:hypothetical protein